MSSTRRVGIGMIGVGGMGRTHAENIAMHAPNARLVGIADVDRARAQTIGSRLGVDTIHSDYTELLRDPSVEAIVEAVPTYLKPEIILAALRSGKHVFAEKPLALSIADADRIVEAAERGGLKVQVGHMRRFDPPYLKMKAEIDAGRVGRVLFARTWTRELLTGKPADRFPVPVKGWNADPKLGGSLIHEVFSHSFDAIRWLTSSEVTSVFTQQANLVYKYEGAGENENYDNAVTTMKLSNGAVAYAEMVLYNLYGYDTGAEVIGTEGSVAVGPSTNTKTRVLKEEKIYNEVLDHSDDRFAQAYRDEMTDFAECIISDRQPRVTARDGREALRVCLAAVQSAKESRAVTVR